MKHAPRVLFAILLLTAGVALAAPNEDWFDLENCGMCKNLTTDQELFAAMQWDTKLFANGLIEITTVPAAYEQRFQKLMAKMEATGQKMMAGEKMEMCSMCMSYGGLMMAGASMEQMHAGESHISVISSRDPAVVEKIRAHGQKTIEEMEKWDAEGGHEQGHDHSGHDHGHGESH